MKFQVSRNIIVNAINLVKDAVAVRTTNPILKTILIEATVPDQIILKATNSQIFTEVMVKAEVEESGSCCVDSLVANLLPSFEEGKYENGQLTNPVKFNLTESKLVITQGRRRHQPAYSSADEFPKKITLDGYTSITNEAKTELVEAFQRLNVSIGVTEERRILQGFNVNPHSEYMISSDGTRTTLRKNIVLPGNIANLPARLVMPVLSKLSSLGESDKVEIKLGCPASGFRIEQYVNDNMFCKWEIIVNCLDGEYPTTAPKQIEEFLQTEPELKVTVNKNLLTKILEICKLYSDKGYNEGSAAYYVILERKGDEVTLSMDVPEIVKMEEPLECQVEGKEEFKILFHPGITLQAVNEVKTETFELRFLGEQMPFFVLDGSNFVYLQACMVSNYE